MKKALIGVWVGSFLLMLICLIVLYTDSRNTATCHKLATLSSIDKSNGIDSQKSYALRFPVR
ncbi:hypothetical protein [Paraglaciecola arctica]|uniref:hypothetical protein n=1 Tax=Paraglaciecola arctica TaxID=1128911 RepID=UPI00129B78AC|nr:hypothetical protein [Paraglaciecola arctica]